MPDPKFTINFNSGLIPPASNRKPQFPVMPILFGTEVEARGRPLLDRSKVSPLIGMYGNDILCNCSSVAIANGINAINALLYPKSAESRSIITTSNVNYFYSQSTGYDPAKPGSDNGADADMVARFVSVNGYPTHQDYLYPLVGEIDHTNMRAIRDGIDVFGVVNVGVGLSRNDAVNDIWDVGTTPDDRIGSGGWHMFNLWDYDGIGEGDLVTALTYGRKQKVTWRWIQERAVLVYGHAYHQLFAPDGELFDHRSWIEYLRECRAHSQSLDCVKAA